MTASKTNLTSLTHIYPDISCITYESRDTETRNYVMAGLKKKTEIVLFLPAICI